MRLLYAKVGVLLLVTTALAGEATLPPAKPVSDIKSIAGTWEGTVSLRDAEILRYTLTVKDDGSWEGIRYPKRAKGGRLLTFQGTMSVSDGKIRYKNETRGTTGIFSLHEDDGKRMLVGSSADGKFELTQQSRP